MRTVTKAQAAEILHISPNEVIRQIQRGELNGKKKTDSKYSDWLVELPDEQEEAKEVDEVKEVLETPEPKEKEEITDEKPNDETEPDPVVEEPEPVVEEPVEVVEEPEGIPARHEVEGTPEEQTQEAEEIGIAEEEPEPVVVVKEEPVKSIPKKEETDVRSKKGDEDLRWWYGDKG